MLREAAVFSESIDLPWSEILPIKARRSLGRSSLYLLEKFYVLRLRAFLTLSNGEFNALSLFQRTEAVRPDFAVVDEHIAPYFTRDKAVAFLSIEPLDSAGFALCHDDTSFRVNLKKSSTPPSKALETWLHQEHVPPL